MKTNIIKGFVALLVAGIAISNFNVFTNRGATDINLSSLATYATAAGEQCLGAAYEDRKQEPGSTCYCSSTGVWVTSQNCVFNGNGCSIISCS